MALSSSLLRSQSLQTLDKSSNDTNEITDQSYLPSNFGSCNHLPPPKHCSTPKSKFSKYKCENIYRSCEEEEDEFKQNSATDKWMEELRSNCVSECMTTFQSKSLFHSENSQIQMLTNLTTKLINILHNQTYYVAKEFDHIYRYLENCCGSAVYQLVENLVYHMISVLAQHVKDGENLYLYYNVLVDISPTKAESPIPLPDLVWRLNSLALDFSKRIDLLLLKQIKIIVSMLGLEQSDEALIIMINGLKSIGLLPDHLGNLLARCNGFQTLIQISEKSPNETVCECNLKLLSSVCCTPSAIKGFIVSGGLELLCEIFLSKGLSQRKFKEGALLLLQITAWLQYKLISLKKYINVFVPTLIGVIKETSDSELLFICAATLANISNDSSSLKPIVENNSAAIMLDCIKRQGRNEHVFLKVQAMTIILNISEDPKFIPKLCEKFIVSEILSLINLEPSPNDSSIVQSAKSRIQYKAVRILANLCSYKETIYQMCQQQGIPILIKLFEDKLEKNHDGDIITVTKKVIKKNNGKWYHRDSTTHDTNCFLKQFEPNITGKKSKHRA